MFGEFEMNSKFSLVDSLGEVVCLRFWWVGCLVPRAVGLPGPTWDTWRVAWGARAYYGDGIKKICPAKAVFCWFLYGFYAVWVLQLEVLGYKKTYKKNKLVGSARDFVKKCKEHNMEV